jgi:hypothetical protein
LIDRKANPNPIEKQKLRPKRIESDPRKTKTNNPKENRGRKSNINQLLPFKEKETVKNPKSRS